MMDADPGPPAGDPDDERRRLSRLVSTLRANGGLGAVAAACHRDVPEVDGVVLSIDAAHAGRIILSDSGPHGDQLEDLHATLGEGPAVDAAATAGPITAADLEDPQTRARWPRFAGQAPAVGIRAVFVHPILLRATPIGALSLYRATAGPWSTATQDQVHRYVNATATVILEELPATSHAGAVDLALPLRAGRVQQAVGIVMEYAGVDAPTALHRLRAYARRSARPMHEVVVDVRACRLPFDPKEAT
jgi:hypothetical protein